MRKKLPFLVLSLFAISCGGGGTGETNESEMVLNSERTRVQEICNYACKTINTNLTVAYKGVIQNDQYIAKTGYLEFSYEGKNYHFDFCGFIKGNTLANIPPLKENCFFVKLENVANGNCVEPSKIFLYKDGRKVGEIKNLFEENTYCLDKEIEENYYSINTSIENFCYEQSCSDTNITSTNLLNNGDLRVSMKFPEKTRKIHSDTDLIRIDISGYINNPDNGLGQEFNLNPIFLTQSNSTASIKVPAGYLRIFVTLWDNNTSEAKIYPVGGRLIYSRIKEGESKNLTVDIPTGIWTLTQPLKGIKRK